ncbi:hypothetical protein PSQ19_11950 [Devosia algicola]|uniref:Uncharacterized protein n=1 Tax=Devosia algicola TaxID=3026418 RepID=A0ABY7YSV4_9HYPH|nr:hypothetical protein [Devosia algicola]WDR04394.1 hypothetical protein PSQ19_11950 [Devosia algicola]
MNFPPLSQRSSLREAVPYLTDIARLEVAWSKAYNAADIKALTVAGFGVLAGEAMLTATLIPHPATTMMSSRYPVGAIWSSHQRTGVTIGKSGEQVLITRPVADVQVTVIPDADGIFAAKLLAGEAIGLAVQTVLDEYSDFDFGRALVGLTTLGAFASIATED